MEIPVSLSLRVSSLLLPILLGDGSVVHRFKRQTYHYDEALLAYANPHPGTKIKQGYLARYAPQDWPKWYSRTVMQWDGVSVHSPYDVNDNRYSKWHATRVKGSTTA
ncbi:unnamed protein product [Angiostrongylus costaricensis]|uniref:Uncharacterized protein n=1 Tax=Angiostrongylus costaricensis TaxID=334426 RepID=A0A3P7I129_ANGCS|nr:unnamed protein product [Angiostrongylus costaricensis]